MQKSNVVQIQTTPASVSCECGRVIFDGEVITTRVLRLFPVAEAKCRCKRWVRVPVRLEQSRESFAPY